MASIILSGFRTSVDYVSQIKWNDVKKGLVNGTRPYVFLFQCVKSQRCLVRYIGIWTILSMLTFLEKVAYAFMWVNGTIGALEMGLIVTVLIALPLLRYKIFYNVLNDIKIKTKICMWEYYLSKYDKLTIDSKYQHSIHESQQTYQVLINELIFVLDQVIPDLIHLISTTYFCVYTLVINGLLNLLTILIITTIVIYFTAIRWIDNKLDIENKIMKRNNEKIQQKLHIELSRFAYKQKDVSHVCKRTSESISTNAKYDKLDSERDMFTSLVLNTFIIGAIILSSATKLIAATGVIIQFTYMSSTIIYLVRGVRRLSKKYEDVCSNFNKCKYVEQEIALSFTGFTIERFSMRRDNYSLTLETPLLLRLGDTVLIKGASGSGKTTFINGIFGVEHADVVLDNGNKPESYLNNLSLLYQSVKDDFHFNHLSIKDLFLESDDISAIELAIDITNIRIIVDRLKKAVNEIAELNAANVNNPFRDSKLDDKYDKYDKYDEYDMKITNWYDLPLGRIGNLSGGEKMRLVLAMQIFDLVHTNKSILILDEPEQGLDAEIACNIIRNIVQNFRGTILTVIISHIENIEVKCEWTHILNIADGIVKVI